LYCLFKGLVSFYYNLLSASGSENLCLGEQNKYSFIKGQQDGKVHRN
jgi:hypothetical protein